MTDPAPTTINIVQGRPTRVSIAGERYRFGIILVERGSGRVSFTVLHDGVDERYRVAAGDIIDAGGCRWNAQQVDAVSGGEGFVQLVRLGGGQQ